MNGGGWEKTNRFIFLMQWQGNAALDRRAPLWGHGWQKTANNNQPSSSDMWELLGACGRSWKWPLMAISQTMAGRRRRTSKKLRSPSPGSNNTQNRLKQQSNGWRRCMGVLRDYRGSQKWPLTPSFLLFFGYQRQAALDCCTAPLSQKMQKNINQPM